jgi:hypothetical protein
MCAECRAAQRRRQAQASRAITSSDGTWFAEEHAAERDAASCDRRGDRPSGPVRRVVYEHHEFDLMWDGT